MLICLLGNNINIRNILHNLNRNNVHSPDLCLYNTLESSVHGINFYSEFGDQMILDLVIHRITRIKCTW
jgi:hypothetical protein